MCDQLTGLAADVERILKSLTNIRRVSFSRKVRGYKGEEKVKIPWRWPPGPMPVRVSSAGGERFLFVETSKPGAIRRILGKRLKALGVTVSV